MVFTLLPSAFNGAHIHCRYIISESLKTTNDEIILRNNILPNGNDEYDIGSNDNQFKNLYINGTAYLDAIGFGTTSLTLPTAWYCKSNT